MKAHRNFPIRLLAFILSFVLLFSAAFSVRAAEPILVLPDSAIELNEESPEEEEAPGEGVAHPAAVFIARQWHSFWRYFQFFSYKLNTTDDYYVYNSRLSFQWLFGFNQGFHDLAFLIGAFIDTIVCNFHYEDRDWKVQMWKGSYLYGTMTGGEIGLYSKPTSRTIEHYDAACANDWIGMEFSVYHNHVHLFHRPMQARWWQTGYAFYVSSRILDRPRDNITMIGALRFNSEGMAQAFAQALADKGMAQGDELPEEINSSVEECYTIEGDTVRFVWRITID